MMLCLNPMCIVPRIRDNLHTREIGNYQKKKSQKTNLLLLSGTKKTCKTKIKAEYSCHYQTAVRINMPYKYKKERMKHDHKSSTHGMRNITERADIHKGYRLFYVSML